MRRVFLWGLEGEADRCDKMLKYNFLNGVYLKKFSRKIYKMLKIKYIYFYIVQKVFQNENSLQKMFVISIGYINFADPNRKNRRSLSIARKKTNIFVTRI